LGINHNATWSQVKDAHKKMCIATHPDKHGGNAKFFMMVHEAFQDLEQQYSQRKIEREAPKTKQHYDPRDQNIPDPKRIPENRFNEYFDTNAIYENDPYRSGGYGHRMSNSVNYQEDHSELMNKKLKLPKNRKVVIYKEPEAIHTNSKWMSNYAELGIEKVDDYSCNLGTDYERAYTNPEECVDTRPKYGNLESLQYERENTNMKMSKEDKEYQRKKEEDRVRMEQYRRQAFNSHNRDVTDRYIQLNNRLQ